MADTIKNRSEILFLYDVTDANPNGDPNDENKPRIDEETGVNIVTDVRLKRTIRDYLYEYKNQEIFIRETLTKDGKPRTKEERLKDFKSSKNVIEECIDLRLFGATTAVQNERMTLTGPVQFKYGRSLHKVDLTYVKGTTVMPSGEGKEQGTFTERYILPYSLIAFYGVVNETAAAAQEIPLTEEDIDLLMEAIWHGTKNLISGSKFGQIPRLLMQVIYKKKENFYLGELDKRIALKSELPDEAIRKISDVKIDVTSLIADLAANNDKISEIRLKVDDRVNFLQDGKDVKIDAALKGAKFTVKPFDF
ncbi:MAG: type I-B CRISPR-associated protein Cas7/Csh2 [candidate division WOR-3 bacterium]|jgi:CRISPR-associated protein Csh2|nr:type I-B CRISPR-associated protein Cas7/Csh2 [candidate division WOR-3 bacterium]MDH7519337.1 type I-B CRISPR-associated protein Cas7/Csh2 [bacterium]